MAGYISPRETVIAGPVAQVDAVVAAVSAQNKFARRVNMEVASHTAFMDPILGELRTALADLSPEIPTIPFYSTVLEGFASPMLDADYWVANVRQPALLSQAVAAAAEEHGTFIEISAHPILTNAVGDTVDPTSHHHSVGTLWRDGDDAVRFHTNLNTVHTSHPPQTPHPVEPHPLLPTTPWHHSRFWVNTRPITPIRSVATVDDPGAYTDGPIPSQWYLDLAWPARALSGAQRRRRELVAGRHRLRTGRRDRPRSRRRIRRHGRADVTAGRGSRPGGDHRCAGRGDPRALRAEGERRPVRFRRRLRTVQRRAPADRGHR